MTWQFPYFQTSKPIVGVSSVGFMLATLCEVGGPPLQGCGLLGNTAWLASTVLRSFILLADWLVGQPFTALNRGLGALLYLAYMLPLVGPFARWTHVQLSVVAMAATVYLIWHVGRGGSANESAAITRMDTAKIAEV